MQLPQISQLQERSILVARMMGVPEKLLQQLITVESDWNPWATRFEPLFRHRTKENTGRGGTTLETENIHQATSWGLCQIMGYTARRLGWEGPIPALLDPESNLRYACLYLNQLYENPRGSHSWRWAITAYNHGALWDEHDPAWFRAGYTAKFNDVLSMLGEA